MGLPELDGERGDLIKIIWHDGQRVPVLEAARARTLSVAVVRRRRCDDLARAARPFAGSDRLAGTAKNLEAAWVGAAAAMLMRLIEVIRAHVFTAERVHGDDTTVPVLAKNKTRTGRLWTYVRDDRPFGGHARPTAPFFFSPDRGGERPNSYLAGCLRSK